MGGYLVNFTVYTMAMLGLISFAVFVFKKFTDGTIRTYSYISNNEGMPKEISFNPSVEDWN